MDLQSAQSATPTAKSTTTASPGFRHTSGRNRFGSAILHLMFFIFVVIWVYPFIWTVSASLKTNMEIFSGSISLFPKEFQWSMLAPAHWPEFAKVWQFVNYSHAWYFADFNRFLVNTSVFTLAVVAIVVSLCAITGYALGRYSFPGKKIFVGVITATLFIPNGYTIIPLWQLINFLHLSKSLWGLILAEAGGTHVLYIFLFMAYFYGIPKELEESAKMDGCGFVRTFATIMLPLAKPVIATAAIMQFIHSWNSFFIPLVFTVHRPDLRTLGVGLYSFVQDHNSDLAGMAAGATISFIPIILVFLFFQRYFVEGVAGAVKG
ncbi:MAG: sugar permease [Paenibacillaceae bacterium]|jgi:raffinose/stachyose/melibiose transport system permease protein|nr:sugar permease [Paenibacillaceae bacterium]